MCDEGKYRIVELIDLMLEAIEVIIQKTSHINTGDDFLMSPDNMFILDGVCMKLIFIGESVKNIDKLSQGKLFTHYPAIPWKDIMKLRDIIAHHYFKIDADIICVTIKEDLPPLKECLFEIKVDILSDL